jgi:hypothetical protein
MHTSTTRPTVPAPSFTPELGDAVAQYIRASERVAAALREQREAIRALRALDSQHPAVAL